ncbi:MAG: ornithine carbamoyltransferase [Anaerolineae bacterium]|jgi:ornithine carbamoyltransferase|nr:ornithine carbamoyltransferase [Anaerolineae bacterium]MBT7189966.1 ornithine carbamoyltransferase [Anaerolineae bacterium]MBT7990768.1 ornithine carbamoyltransferase [Anaerolineae bacterium]
MGKNFITIDDFSADEIRHIFDLAGNSAQLKFSAGTTLTACYSFEGNSLRTRATFVKALSDLNITPIGIPNFLKTEEGVEHLAGYMDSWFDIYILRDRNHARLASFAESTQKPTINAMTSEAHPCEVLADVYSVWKEKGDLRNLKYCLLGPPTNVLKSWQRIGKVLGLNLIHVLPQQYKSEGHQDKTFTSSKEDGLKDADVILTDAWPQDFDDRSFQLKLDDLEVAKSDAWVIPCPPFSVQNEIHQDIISSEYFAGYGQKKYLYHVQKALIYYLLSKSIA